jgi:phage replication O-like protein O
MATNKKENTFTQIPNGVLEALAKYNIPGNTRRCLDVIMRKTWGWRKDEDTITNSQIEQAAGLDKSNVSKALRWLEERRIIFVGKNTNKRLKTIGINKKYETWKKPVKKPKKAVGKNANKTLVDQSTNVGENTNKTLVNTPNTKEINKIKKEKKRASPNPELKNNSGLDLPSSYLPKSEQDIQNNIVNLKKQAEQITKNDFTNS